MFEAEQMFSDVLGEDLAAIVDIHDAGWIRHAAAAPTAENLLYGDGDESTGAEHNSPSVDLAVGLRRWRVSVIEDDSDSAAVLMIPLVAGLGGVFLNITLAGLVHTLVQRRKFAEQLVSERTVELRTNAEALKRSNEELSDFAYAASHDLQAPMRHVSGSVEMLMEDLEGVEIDEEAQ